MHVICILMQISDFPNKGEGSDSYVVSEWKNVNELPREWERKTAMASDINGC